MNPAILDDDLEIKKIDPQDMLGAVSKFPQMLSSALKASSGVTLPEMPGIKGIVVSGMGGSAICGDVVKGVLDQKISVPIVVNRGYSLPKFVTSGYLFFAASYSGNTEETLGSLKEAQGRGLNIIAITSGGKLLDIARENSYPIFSCPAGLQPRAALPHFIVPVLSTIEKLRLAGGLTAEIDEAAKLLSRLKNEYLKPIKENPVKQLAQRLYGKTPVILATEDNTRAVAMRWLAQLAENSKVFSHVALLPEMDHNEIVGLGALKKGEHNLHLIILRDEADSERVKKRIEITKSFIGPGIGGATDITSIGSGRLTRLLSLILFGDFLSVYLAIQKGVDPSKVEVIDRLKRELLR